MIFDIIFRLSGQSTGWTVRRVASQIFSVFRGENCSRVKVSSKHFVEPLVSFQISEEKVYSQQKFNVEKLTLHLRKSNVRYQFHNDFLVTLKL